MRKVFTRTLGENRCWKGLGPALHRESFAAQARREEAQTGSDAGLVEEEAMPLFDFVCENKSCVGFGRPWEEFIGSYDFANPHCPVCGEVAERKILSRAASFQWGKGGGWN